MYIQVDFVLVFLASVLVASVVYTVVIIGNDKACV